jgi:hypothetical protein
MNHPRAESVGGAVKHHGTDVGRIGRHFISSGPTNRSGDDAFGGHCPLRHRPTDVHLAVPPPSVEQYRHTFMRHHGDVQRDTSTASPPRTVVNDRSWITTAQVTVMVLPALVVAIAVEIGLRRLRLPTLCRIVGARFDGESPANGSDGAPPDTAQSARLTAVDPSSRPRVVARRHISWALASHGVLRRLPWPDTCLRRALLDACGWRRLGPTLRIGVKRVDGVIKAHAWLDVGTTSFDPEAPNYLVLNQSG